MYSQQVPQPHDERAWSGSNPEYQEGYQGGAQYQVPQPDPRVTPQPVPVAPPLISPPLTASPLLSFGRSSSTPAGMRLALAIVSVVMLIPLTAIVLNTLEALGGFGQLIGLGVICVAVLGINIAFNYRS